MLKSKVENIIFGNHFLGIEVFSENNSEKGNYILVEKKKDSLTIFDNSSFANITDISLENYTDLPAVLSIYTDKVLIKETELVEKNDLILIKKTFTNLNLKDFYIDIWRLENKSIISIARKSYVDEMIKLFWKNHQIKIVSVTIGISSIKHLVSFLSEETILLNSKMFNKQNKTISSNEEITSIIYPINGINIKSDNLISFSSIINFISKSNSGSSIDELNTNLNDTFFQNTFYRKYIKFFIFFILGVLLVNFLFFNHYYNKFVNRQHKVD